MGIFGKVQRGKLNSSWVGIGQIDLLNVRQHLTPGNSYILDWYFMTDNVLRSGIGISAATSEWYRAGGGAPATVLFNYHYNNTVASATGVMSNIFTNNEWHRITLKFHINADNTWTYEHFINDVSMGITTTDDPVQFNHLIIWPQSDQNTTFHTADITLYTGSNVRPSKLNGSTLCDTCKTDPCECEKCDVCDYDPCVCVNCGICNEALCVCFDAADIIYRAGFSPSFTGIHIPGAYIGGAAGLANYAGRSNVLRFDINANNTELALMLGAGTLELGQSYALDYYYFAQSTTQVAEKRLQLGWWGGWPVLYDTTNPVINIPLDTWVHMRMEFSVSVTGGIVFTVKINGTEVHSGDVGSDSNPPGQLSFYFNATNARVFLSEAVIARVS